MWAGLAHPPCRNEFGDQNREQAERIQVTQLHGCPIRLQYRIQFVVNAFGCRQWKQSGIALDKVLRLGFNGKPIARFEADSAEHTQRVVFEDIIVDCFDLPCLDIGEAVEGVDEHVPGTRLPGTPKGHHYISRLEELNDFGQGSGNGVDGEVALPQVFLDAIAFDWGDINDGFLPLVFDDDTASFVMQVDIVACQFIGQAAC